jgi:transcriptional regulator GlxA family with amidase domain
MKSALSHTLAIVLVLVATAAAAQADQPPITVGILLLNQPFITELAGPLDVYHHVPKERIRVLVISDTDQEQVTYEGMPFRASATIDNAPKIDVLVVPSGAGSLGADQKNERVISWIKRVAAEAMYVTSHCEGAFLLAAAGVLDGKRATTFPADVDALQAKYPTCKVRKDARIVVDGNIITSAGGLASYEAALYVVEKLFGKEQAATIGTALVFGPSNFAALKTVAETP